MFAGGWWRSTAAGVYWRRGLVALGMPSREVAKPAAAREMRRAFFRTDWVYGSAFVRGGAGGCWRGSEEYTGIVGELGSPSPVHATIDKVKVSPTRPPTCMSGNGVELGGAQVASRRQAACQQRRAARGPAGDEPQGRQGCDQGQGLVAAGQPQRIAPGLGLAVWREVGEDEVCGTARRLE